jgi:hypothetical protein
MAVIGNLADNFSWCVGYSMQQVPISKMIHEFKNKTAVALNYVHFLEYNLKLISMDF